MQTNSQSKLSTNYSPKDWESRIYNIWTKNKVGIINEKVSISENTESSSSISEDTFTILMPPPNLTGSLHAGHALEHYIMDSLRRYYFQKGLDSFYQPGVDHAGIQLEGVIDGLIKKGELDELLKNSIAKHDSGKENTDSNQEISNNNQEIEIEHTGSIETKNDQPPILFDKYYPTQVMTTSKAIFYAWIVRMIMAGVYFTGDIPFETYLDHGTILDESGKKMSKSLNNGMDPVEQIQKYSSDSTRLALLGVTNPGRDARMGGKLADSLCEKYRNFGNKLWNIARFFEYTESQEKEGDK